jgi:hypothetical protein
MLTTLMVASTLTSALLVWVVASRGPAALSRRQG